MLLRLKERNALLGRVAGELVLKEVEGDAKKIKGPFSHRTSAKFSYLCHLLLLSTDLKIVRLIWISITSYHCCAAVLAVRIQAGSLSRTQKKK